MNVATPSTAVAVAGAQVTVPAPPVSGTTVRVTTVVSSLTTRSPSASWISTTGWTANGVLGTPSLGCVVKANFVAGPTAPADVDPASTDAATRDVIKNASANRPLTRDIAYLPLVEHLEHPSPRPERTARRFAAKHRGVKSAGNNAARPSERVDVSADHTQFVANLE